jgi:N-glycosylase/DNA lyase
MMEQPGAYNHVEELRSAFDSRKAAIRQRLAEFSSVSPDDYFFEMAYCILTPQSNATRAAAAVNALRTLDQWEDPVLMARTLSRQEFYIRFHHTKAKRLARAHAQFPEIAARLKDRREGWETREWLVANVGGLGWKEASHFLRNIGHRDLAILDRHILKNLHRHGIISTIPRTMTRNNYLAIEQQFAHFSDHVGLTMDELDLLFWSTETGQILK